MNKCGVEKHRLLFVCSSCFVSNDTKKDEVGVRKCKKHLTTETVQSATLAFEGVDDIHGGDGLSACVLGVGDGITDDGLKEDLEDTTGLFVDKTRDTFDTTTACKTADGGFGNTLDVVTQDFAVTFGTTLS